MRAAVAIAVGLAVAVTTPVLATPAKPTPSAPLRAYKGPEGQIVAVVPVADNKQVLVYFRNLDGELDGKSLLYELDTSDEANKEVYVVKKRGSKTYHSQLLIEHDGSWTFYHPTKANITFAIRYSESESDQLKVDDVVNAYKP
jgi:hypothetical protein